MRRSRRVFHLFNISTADYNKHKKRVTDIVNIKAVGDLEKQKRLATIMADKIENVDKAYGRYLVSDELNQPELAKIFLNRFKELTYSLKDLRREKLLEFLEEDDEENESI